MIQLLPVLPDFLRSLVTNIMLLVLLVTLARPKRGRKVQAATLGVIILFNLAMNLYFYVQNDYTTLAKLDILFFVGSGIAIKPLFRETPIQWLFNFFTVMNIYSIVVFLSYHLCDLFPFPYYAITVLRFLLFTGAVVLFRKYLRPFYWQAVERWNVYLLASVALFLNFIWYFFTCDDVEQMLTEDFVPLLLLSVLTVFLYLTILLSLRETILEHTHLAEKLRMNARQELLQAELAAQESFVYLARQNRHDLRHHNALLADYLDRGDVAGARAYLCQHDASIAEAALTQYCKNPVANAVLRLYARRAEDSDVAFSAEADIPAALPLTAPESCELFGNLLENACEACEKAGDGAFLALTARVDDESLKLELKNTVAVLTAFDEAGLPLTTKEGGGTGTRSAAGIVRQHGGMLHFSQENGVFFTRMVLPLN